MEVKEGKVRRRSGLIRGVSGLIRGMSEKCLEIHESRDKGTGING